MGVRIGARVVGFVRAIWGIDGWIQETEADMPVKRCVKRALDRLALYSTIDSLRHHAKACESYTIHRVENS